MVIESEFISRIRTTFWIHSRTLLWIAEYITIKNVIFLSKNKWYREIMSWYIIQESQNSLIFKKNQMKE